jgi:D-ribose pyranose/furanose isomerase RbsD
LLKNKTLVISDVEFSFLAEIVTIDISQVRGTPIAQRVLEVIAENFVIRQAWVSEEVLKANAEGDDAMD